MELKELQQLRKEGLSCGDIGKKFNVSRQRIFQILSGYKQECSLEYSIKRNKIKQRDHYKCRLCDTKKNYSDLVIHHADQNRQNNDELNLMTLCKSCHSSLHATKRYKNFTNYKCMAKTMVLRFTGDREKIHTKLKSICALSKETMNDKVIDLIDLYNKKHSKR